MSQPTDVRFERQHVTVEYHATTDTVLVDWHDLASGDQFRGALDRGLRAVRDEAATRWLADFRALDGVNGADRAWLERTWFPRAIESGLAAIALVEPERAATEPRVDNVTRAGAGTTLVTRQFDDRSAAREWLTDHGP